MVRIQTLGAAALLVGDARLDPSADTLFALLVRTVYSPGSAVGRDVLLRSLWAGQPETRQRANLRQALYKSRLLGVRIGLRGDVVALDPTQLIPVFAVERTVPRFEQDVTRGHEPFGAFLPGYSTGWPEYDEWLAMERESVHADVRHVLVEQLSARRVRADWAGADTLAKWLLQFDPLNEEATLTVAECLALNGSKREAVALIDRYLDDLGPDAGELRVSASVLRRRVSEPHRPRRQRPSFAPTERHFVGREELMTELTLAMRRAKWGDGSAELLHGPPGMGKTRVTRELSKVATIEGFRVVTTECRESDQHRPLSIFLDLVPDLLSMPGAMACDPASMRVLKRLVNDSSDAEATDDSGQGEPSARAEPSAGLHREPLPLPSVLRRSIVDLVSNVCFEHATLIIAENLHWVDELSATVFADLVVAAPGSKFFILATSRQHTTPTLVQVLTAGMQARVLQPLSNGSARELAAAICADLDTECEPDVHEWFIRASEGTPLFLRALVNHWIETGSAGGVPPTLAALIDQRLAALGEDALRTIQAAGLLGRHATAQTVTELLEFSVIRMVGAMEELAAAGAYFPTANLAIEFHELIARAALGKLSVPSTRLLHSRAAAVLQVSRLDADDATPVDIVVHYREAGGEAELVEYAVRAASGYLHRGLPHRALAVCEAAQRGNAASEKWEEVARVEMAALYAAGQHCQLTERLPVTVRSCRDPIWDERHAEQVLHFVDSLRHNPIVGDNQELASRVLLLAESPRLVPSTRLAAASAVLRTATVGVSTATAARAYDAGVCAAAELHNSEEAHHEINMFYHTWFGQLSIARTSAVWLAHHVDRRASRSTAIRLLSNVCYSLRVTGETTLAYSFCGEVFEEAVAAGMTWIAALLAWNASLIALDSFNDPDLAQSWLERPECNAPEIGGQHSGLVIQENRVRVAIVRNEPERAREELKKIDIASIDFSAPSRASYYFAMQIGTAVINGDLVGLSSILPAALQCFSSTKTIIGQDFFTQQLVMGLHTLGRSSEASDILSEYLAHHRRSGNAAPRYLLDATQMLQRAPQ